jgi:hypothetical protein
MADYTYAGEHGDRCSESLDEDDVCIEHTGDDCAIDLCIWSVHGGLGVPKEKVVAIVITGDMRHPRG